MSFLRKAAFAAPLALLAPAANAQTMAVPERVPDGVQFVLSVNDSASLWTAYNATALAANVREIMELPDVKQNPDLQEVALEMDKAELELGFATTPGALMGEVLRGFDFYAVKAPGADRPSTLLAARFRNADQAAKLVSYVRARMESDAAAAGQPAQAWQTTNFQGIDIVGEGTDAGNYALMGDVLLLGSTLAVVQDSIASPGASRLTANPQFANTFAKVPAREGQVFFYADAGEMASVANMLNGGSLDASMLPKSRIAGVLSASPRPSRSITTRCPTTGPKPSASCSRFLRAPWRRCWAWCPSLRCSPASATSSTAPPSPR